MTRPQSTTALQAQKYTRRRFQTPSMIILAVLLVNLMAAALPARPAFAADKQPGDVATPATVAHATLGKSYRQRFTVGGSHARGVFLEAGSLPLGLELAPDGTVSGVPINGGEYFFIMRTGDGIRSGAAQEVALVVDDPPAEDLAAVQPQVTDASTNVWANTSAFFADMWLSVVGRTNLVGTSRPVTVVEPAAVSEVVAWGINNHGQSNVPSGLTDVIAIAAGRDHSLAQRSGGAIVVWGSNSNGEQNVPANLGNVKAIAAGFYHNLVLKGDGTVVAWGSNSHGQATVPAGLSSVVAIDAGARHSLAVRSNGTVVAWGSNENGQATVPAGLNDIVAVSGGGNLSLALKRNGTVVAWGANNYGQATVPAGLSNVVAVAAGETHALALKGDGTVVAWGSNAQGQTTVPAGLKNVTSIAAGTAHGLALKSDGTVVAWGANNNNQGTVPAGLSSVIAISAEFQHNLALVGTLPPTPTRTATASATRTATKTVVPTATSTVVATRTATKTVVPTATRTATATPPPSVGYRDVGTIRIWADTFSPGDGDTTASGKVRVGSAQTNTAYYAIGSSATWGDSGPVTLKGTLAMIDGATLGSGTVTAVRATGVVNFGSGFVPSLNRLGTSNIAIQPTFSINVREPRATVDAKVTLQVPENVGQTFRLSYELGPKNTVTAKGTSSVSLTVAGCTLSVQASAATNGLVISAATLKLPAIWNGTSVTVNDVVVTHDNITIGGAGATFPIPNLTLGSAVKLNGLTGKLHGNVSGKYSFGVTAASVVFTAGTDSSTLNNVQFSIANGKPSATIDTATVTVAGLSVIGKQIAYADGVFTATSTTLKLPATWNSPTVSVSNLRIDNNGISIGGAGATFPIPDVKLGSSNVLTLTKMTGSLAATTQGDYQFSISATVKIEKVSTSSGGNNLTVAGTLWIKNGKVSGSISTLEFQVSGVNFKAVKMQFVDDKLTVEKASLTLPIKGSNVSATVYGLELGGSAGFKLQGAKVTLPDFTVGTVGVKGAMFEFKTESDGSYTVAGSGEFVFTQFSVAGSFKIGYSQASGVALRSVHLTFQGKIPAPAIALGTTGFSIIRISGGFDMSDASTTISLGLGAASVVGVGSVSVLALDADVTLQIKPKFSLSAKAGAKLVGITVATADLYVSSSAFTLKGTITISVVKVSLELAFGKDASSQFTFYGNATASVVIPRGYFCGDSDWYCPTFPRSDYKLASARLDGGKFKRGGDVIWGARGKFSLWKFDLYAWYKFAPGTDYGLGDKLESYAPVKPAGLTAAQQAAGEQPYLVTVTKPAAYLMILETVAEQNRATAKDIKVKGPTNVAFTQSLAYEEPDGSLRLYRIDFAKPQAAVGTWTLTTPTGNIAGMLGGTPTPTVDTLSVCVTATNCLSPTKPLALANGKTLDVAWSTSSPNPGMTMDVYAEGANGMRYPISHGETANKTTLTGADKWTLGLPSGTYTVMAMLEQEDVGPIKVEQGVITINDTTGPAAPRNLTTIVAGDNSATLRWNGAAAEADVAGYQVSVNDRNPITVEGRLTDYMTYGLQPGALHKLKVAGYDFSGNVGPWAIVNVTTPTIGVASAWPLNSSTSGTVAEVGASYNTPITGAKLVVRNAAGTVVPGTVTLLTGDRDVNTTVTLGAVFTPTTGTLKPGTYTASVKALDAATGTLLQHTWSFTVLVGGSSSNAVYLPLIRR